MLVLWCLALPLTCTQATAPSSHCPHLQVMGSHFSAGGTQGKRSCRLPWARRHGSCESVPVPCSWRLLLDHLSCIAEATLAPLVTGENKLLWAGSGTWECAWLVGLAFPSAWLGLEHPLPCQVFLLFATACVGVPRKGGLVPLGCLALCLCHIVLQII